MESRFTYDPSGTPSARDYYTDRVVVRWEVDADEYTLLDDSVHMDVRLVRPVFEVEAVFEQTAGTATTPGALLLDLLKGSTTVRFYPDASNASVYADVVPDIGHQPTLMATVFGMVERRAVLRFKANQWYAPSDALMAQFAALTPLTS